MKRRLVPAAASARTAAPSGLRFFAIVLVAASLGVVVGCGGEEGLSREELSARLQSIGQRGSERWGRLAELANDVKPGQPLPTGVEQAIGELVEFQREAAGELEELDSPEQAEEEVDKLVEALRERTEIFEQVLEAGRFTQREFDRITESGDRINEAFEQLRTDGFLPEEEEHES